MQFRASESLKHLESSSLSFIMLTNRVGISDSKYRRLCLRDIRALYFASCKRLRDVYVQKKSKGLGSDQRSINCDILVNLIKLILTSQNRCLNRCIRYKKQCSDRLQLSFPWTTVTSEDLSGDDSHNHDPE